MQALVCVCLACANSFVSLFANHLNNTLENICLLSLCKEMTTLNIGNKPQQCKKKTKKQRKEKKIHNIRCYPMKC